MVLSIMFACLAEELGKANLAMQDFEPFWNLWVEGALSYVQRFFLVLNIASTYAWVASIAGAFCFLCSDKGQLHFIGTGCRHHL